MPELRSEGRPCPGHARRTRGPCGPQGTRSPCGSQGAGCAEAPEGLDSLYRTDPELFSGPFGIRAIGRPPHRGTAPCVAARSRTAMRHEAARSCTASLKSPPHPVFALRCGTVLCATRRGPLCGAVRAFILIGAFGEMRRRAGPLSFVRFRRNLKFFPPIRNSLLHGGESRVYFVSNKSIASNALTRKVRTNPSSESRRLLRAGGGRPESRLRAVEFQRRGRSPGNPRRAPWQVGLNR